MGVVESVEKDGRDLASEPELIASAGGGVQSGVIIDAPPARAVSCELGRLGLRSAAVRRSPSAMMADSIADWD